MNATAHKKFLQHFNTVQNELLPTVEQDVGGLTPILVKLIHTLEWVRLEELVPESWCGVGRPAHARTWLANAFMVEITLKCAKTVNLIDRLKVDWPLRRICGFSIYKKVPSEATFSRALAEFADTKLAERAPEILIKETLGEVLIGHISRDGTAIAAREKPQAKAKTADKTVESPQPKKRGRTRNGEVRPPAKESPIAVQRLQTLSKMLIYMQNSCGGGVKCNFQGYKEVDAMGVPCLLDDMYCGLGAFGLHIAGSGTVTPLDPKAREGSHLVKIDKLGFYLKDTYDFNEDQPLGYWAEDGVTKSAGPGRFAVENKLFRDWRARFKQGGDFMIFSDVRWEGVSSPILWPYSGK